MRCTLHCCHNSQKGSQMTECSYRRAHTDRLQWQTVAAEVVWLVDAAHLVLWWEVVVGQTVDAGVEVARAGSRSSILGTCVRCPIPTPFHPPMAQHPLARWSHNTFDHPFRCSHSKSVMDRMDLVARHQTAQLMQEMLANSKWCKTHCSHILLMDVLRTAHSGQLAHMAHSCTWRAVREELLAVLEVLLVGLVRLVGLAGSRAVREDPEMVLPCRVSSQQSC